MVMMNQTSRKNMPNIIVLSDDNADNFKWCSDGWFTTRNKHKPENKELMAKVEKQSMPQKTSQTPSDYSRKQVSAYQGDNEFLSDIFLLRRMFYRISERNIDKL